MLENAEALQLLRAIVDAYDAGAVRIESAEITIQDEPPHPWHEEWLSYVRRLIK